MGCRRIRRCRRRLIHYWDQHPVLQLRARAVRAGAIVSLLAGGAAWVVRTSPAIVAAGLVVGAGVAVGVDIFGELVDTRRRAERDERSALRLRPALAARRRRVQELLDQHVPSDAQPELMHEIGLYHGLEDAMERLDAHGAVEIDGILVRPVMPPTFR